MSTPHEVQSVAVAETAGQMEEARSDKWNRLEHLVWTERMLAALRKGVKGGVWLSVIDKVYRPSTLYAAWLKFKVNKGSAGSDHQSIGAFEKELMGTWGRAGGVAAQRRISHLMCRST